MQDVSVPSHIDSCTCHGRPQSCGIHPPIPGNQTSVSHTPYDTPVELYQDPRSLSPVSVHPTAAVDSTASAAVIAHFAAEVAHPSAGVECFWL